MENKNWSLSKIWNLSLEIVDLRPVEPRGRIYASEMGRADIDIWLKMKGTEPSNPPDSRAQRKFHAGDLYEWFVLLVLKKCGVLIAKQLPVKSSLPNCVEVSGRLDFIAGGNPNYEEGQKKVDALIAELDMPPLFHKITNEFISMMKAHYPNGLDEKVLEVKSTAVFGFEKVETTGKALAGHDLQNFHYAHGLNMQGSLCYISRDDLRMYEIPIMPTDEKLMEKYVKKVEKISHFYNEDIMPPKEPLILFDEEMGKFSKNFNVEYSSFLTLLYGIEKPSDYDDMVSPKIERWNRVLGRVKKGEKMTDNNILALDEMRAEVFDPNVIISLLKK